jgi:N-acetylmuramoyl-L-alanine amidase
VSDSTAASHSNVRRRTVVVRRNGSAAKSSSANSKKPGQPAEKKIPERPRVTVGPRAVKEFKNRQRAVIRFFITQDFGTREMRNPAHAGKTNRPWIVVDATIWRSAVGTAPEGYREKDEAIRIARKYRDEYGAYCRSPF